MTIIHILNYTIPIAFMVFLGFLVDWMCKPDAIQENTEEEA